MKILVVKFDLESRDDVLGLLKGEGFLVDEADTGEEALSMAHQNHYRLIVSDVVLPDMPGLAAIKKIRDKGIHSSILILTSRVRWQDIINGFMAGADRYLDIIHLQDTFLLSVSSLLSGTNELKPSELIQARKAMFNALGKGYIPRADEWLPRKEDWLSREKEWLAREEERSIRKAQRLNALDDGTQGLDTSAL